MGISDIGIYFRDVKKFYQKETYWDLFFMY